MKKLFFVFCLFFLLTVRVSAEELTSYAESAYLIEASTGEVLYEKDSEVERSPASMTKIMSMILIMDAINNKQFTLDDNVLISKNASDMGGSQVYLNTGDTYKVKELLKSIAIASANDAVVTKKQSLDYMCKTILKYSVFIK